MPTETYKAPKQQPKGVWTSELSKLKPGQAIRLRTAKDWRLVSGQLVALGRRIGVQFASVNDGNDVLVYIKAK